MSAVLLIGVTEMTTGVRYQSNVIMNGPGGESRQRKGMVSLHFKISVGI